MQHFPATTHYNREFGFRNHTRFGYVDDKNDPQLAHRGFRHKGSISGLFGDDPVAFNPGSFSFHRFTVSNSQTAP
jgi:hypothetical protein